MATEPRYAEVLAHIEEVEASRRARAAEQEAEAEQRRALADTDALPKGGTGIGELPG
jgi:hypothetical protein